MFLNLFGSIFFIITFNILLVTQLLGLEYTTNFMWVYQDPESSTQEKYVFPEIRKKGGENWDVEVVKWINSWLEQNKPGKFVFWFDRRNVTQEQIANTEQLFKELNDKLMPHGGKIELKDIWSLGLVNEKEAAFNNDAPFYLKLDLLRMVAAWDYLEKCLIDNKECVFIYADIDRGSEEGQNGVSTSGLSEKELFKITTNPHKLNDEADLNLLEKYYAEALEISEEDQEFEELKEKLKTNELPVMPFLEKYGLIRSDNHENNFFMMSNHQRAFVIAIKKFIDDEIEYITTALSQKEEEIRKKIPKENIFSKLFISRQNLKKHYKDFYELDEEIRKEVVDLITEQTQHVFTNWTPLEGQSLGAKIEKHFVKEKEKESVTISDGIYNAIFSIQKWLPGSPNLSTASNFFGILSDLYKQKLKEEGAN